MFMNCRTVALSFTMLTLVLTVDAAPQGVFNPTPTPMTSPRALHRATSLGDGRVLITGGLGDFAASGNVVTAEIFDPAGPVFQVTNSTPCPNPQCPVVSRSFHRATLLLEDGTVLITGGDTRGGGGGSLASAEIFDPMGNTFTDIGPMGPGNTRRSGHTATLLVDGKVLITGGFDGNAILSSPRLYDPAYGTFADTNGPMVEARFRHTATLLADGKVLIAGGQGAAFGLLDSAEIFDPATKTFTATDGPMTKPRGVDHTATLLGDGTVLLEGGRKPNPPSSGTPTADLYDPVTNTFREAAGQMPGPRNFHTASLLDDGRVLIAGGQLGANPTFRAAIYDPMTETFTETDHMMLERDFHTATPLDDGIGTVLITGGFGKGGSVNTLESSAEIFTP